MIDFPAPAGLRRLARLAAVLLALAPAGRAVAAPTVPLAREPLRMGAAWYPEQWPQARWDADLALMQAAHLDVVRVGEFAWSRMEPAEGVYDWAWLDAAIAAAGRHGIAVVLGTPTAAPPAWLTSRYPDTLRVDESGQRDEHGGRQQFSYASARYRAFARDIAERMAQRYGANPNVIGWQVDNELSAESYDPETRGEWRRWLQHKYGAIAVLNQRWTTAYWSQTYESFDQVPMHGKGQNPGLALDYSRFVSDTWRSYLDNQVQVIRAHAAPGQFVTTNTMGWFAGFNHYDLHQDLDLAAWDDYIPSGLYDWPANAVRHDLVRGFKQQDFWVMETQPAFVNWGAVNRALDPGQTREMAWQAVGHGADAVLYWQWRSALNGQEQYHGVLVGADGTPVPVYAEIARTAAEFERASPVLAGTAPHAQVAMIQDYDSRWAIELQRQSEAFDPVKAFTDMYRPLQAGAQAVDVVSADAPLAGYRLVVAPSLNVLTPEEAKRLADYVQGGGHLVLGPRSGMKDAFDALNVQRQPGPLAGLLGARVEQFYSLEAPVPVAGAAGTGEAQIWAEALGHLAPDVQVQLRYGPAGRWTDGQPAMVTRRVGRGSVTYLGAWLDSVAMAQAAAGWLKEAAVRPVLADAPPDVEVCERDGGGRRVLILINHGAGARTLALPGPMQDALQGGPAGQTLTLAPHAVAVLYR